MVGSIISSSGGKRTFAHVGGRFGSGIRCQPSRPDQRQEWMHSNDHWQATVVPDTMWGNSQDQAPDQRQTWMHSNDHWQAARTTTCRQLKRPLAGITCEVCSVCVCEMSGSSLCSLILPNLAYVSDHTYAFSCGVWGVFCQTELRHASWDCGRSKQAAFFPWSSARERFQLSQGRGQKVTASSAIGNNNGGL